MVINQQCQQKTQLANIQGGEEVKDSRKHLTYFSNVQTHPYK
jgi:hypothetical protein